MEFFKKYFGEWYESDSGEAHVKCPFPHTDKDGNRYYETVPSAHINLEKGLFHCKVCKESASEAAFLSKVQNISYKDALMLLKDMDTHENSDWIEERKAFLNSIEANNEWAALGLTPQTAAELKIGREKDGVSFPVFIYGELLDVRNYKAGRMSADGKRSLKVLSRKGAKKLLLPFDLWVENEKPTLLCAGEKDMAIARQNGFNAITFTGGEGAFPKLFKGSFRGKKIYIAYDNDQAGQEGGRQVASLLKECGAIPHVVTGHYSICTQKGEDLHDFFMKYGQTATNLQTILDETPEFTEEEHMKEQVKRIPLVSITESMEGQYANRLVSSRVSIVATYEEGYHVPEYVEFYKYDEGTAASKNKLPVRHTAVWTLDDENVKDILELMDSNLKEAQINTALRIMAGIPAKEEFVRMTVKSKKKVHKAVVMDDLESEVTSGNEEAQSMRELLVYTFDEIKAGKKYRIQYKPTAHPLKGQQIVGIVLKLEDSDSSVNKFTVTEGVLASLEPFKVKEGETVADKMQELYERAKGLIGVEARKDVTFATDLFFHTPLQFYFGRRLERGYLDVMMIGDPRTGKSQAAKKLLETYELGLITSLKTATTAGLLGGSDQTAGGWKTKLGLLPRNHKGAIIMEEFSGGGKDLVSKLTEVRSSNRVRLTRVNGSIDVPAMVRMMSISNPATGEGRISRALRSYPNGIQVILDLVGASEDIARYDFFLLVDEPDEYISPLDDFEQEPFEKEAYMNRIRWIWSRSPEQIVMDRPILEAIVKAGEELNKEYNSHIKIFGPEVWKKISRIAIACAAMVCSMDETGEKVIVNEEHVQWAKTFLVDRYDNKLFKLKEYVAAQRRLVECDDNAVRALEGLWNNHAIMLQQLEMSTDISARDLQMISGLDQKEFPKVLNQLAKYAFIRYDSKISPTDRFRTAMGLINRNQYMPKLGEE